MTMDVTETGCVVQAGGNVFFLQPGKSFENIIKTVASTQVGKNGSHRNARPLDDRLSVADVWMGFDAVHGVNMGGNCCVVNGEARAPKGTEKKNP